MPAVDMKEFSSAAEDAAFAKEFDIRQAQIASLEGRSVAHAPSMTYEQLRLEYQKSHPSVSKSVRHLEAR